MCVAFLSATYRLTAIQTPIGLSRYRSPYCPSRQCARFCAQGYWYLDPEHFLSAYDSLASILRYLVGTPPHVLCMSTYVIDYASPSPPSPAAQQDYGTYQVHDGYENHPYQDDNIEYLTNQMEEVSKCALQCFHS